METVFIKDYIREFQKRKFPEIVKRELDVKEMGGKAITIIGPRRSGKTFYFFDIINSLKREEVLYMDFEELFLREITPKEILRVILEIFPEVVGKSPKFLFLDEMQSINGWESLVRTLLNRGFKVYITGSSSKLLSKEVATQLRGRTVKYLLLPFSFREFLKAKKIRYDLNLLSSVGRLKRALKEYIRFGGFPEVVLYGNKERIIKEYLDLAFFKDFVERSRVENIPLARSIFAHILQNFSNEFSIRSLERRLKSKGLKFGIITLYKYVYGLEDTLFFFFLKRFSFKCHIRETWPKKVYLCDVGLSLGGRFSEDIGKRMENVVFLELLRETNERPLLELYYYKDRKGEVDFLIKEGERVNMLVQVTSISDRDDLDKREIASLISCYQKFKRYKPKMVVITWDYEATEKFDKKEIKFLPLWKWLIKDYTNN